MEEKLFILFAQDFHGINGMKQQSGKSMDISNMPMAYIETNILPLLQEAKIIPMLVFDPALHR